MNGIKKYTRIPFNIEAIQVSEENLRDVAAWCEGSVERLNGREHIAVPVFSPVNDRQKRAYSGDWVLKSKKGFRVFTDGAFKASFVELALEMVEKSEAITSSVGEDGVSSVGTLSALPPHSTN